MRIGVLCVCLITRCSVFRKERGFIDYWNKTGICIPCVLVEKMDSFFLNNIVNKWEWKVLMELHVVSSEWEQLFSVESTKDCKSCFHCCIPCYLVLKMLQSGFHMIISIHVKERVIVLYIYLFKMCVIFIHFCCKWFYSILYGWFLFIEKNYLTPIHFISLCNSWWFIKYLLFMFFFFILSFFEVLFDESVSIFLIIFSVFIISIFLVDDFWI